MELILFSSVINEKYFLGMQKNEGNAKRLSKIHSEGYLTKIESLYLKLSIFSGWKVSFYILFLSAQVQDGIFSAEFLMLNPTFDL